MTSFYKAPRSKNWNYGGPNWKLSRSKIDLFFNCPRCFYLDNKRGVPRPKGFPFNLNSAVDALLKKEFDMYRTKGIRHPLMEQYGIDAIPFSHDKLDEWRENFKGVTAPSPYGEYLVSGAVDDLWEDKEGNVHVVDYKATSKDTEVSLDEDWQIGYKRQVETYQWLLRKNGLKVSDTAYFVYCNGRRDEDAFDGQLLFDIKIIPYVGNADWIEKTLEDIEETLQSEKLPKPGEDCDYCKYRGVVKQTLEKK